MNKNGKLLLLSTLMIVLTICAACGSPKNRSVSPDPRTPGAPSTIRVDEVTLKGLDVERLASYQTYYLMSYPPEGYDFIRIEVSIDGTPDPEAWGRANLAITDDQQRYTPSHVRRVLIGDDYEYLVDEDFRFRYQFFFSIPTAAQQKDLALIVAAREVVLLDGLLAGEARSSGQAKILESPTEEAPGEYSVIAGGSDNLALATHTTVSGGQLNLAAVAYATVGGGRENRAQYLYTTIAGGYGNVADGRDSSIAGGSRNSASGDHAAIGGGIRNHASGSDSTISGGAYNLTDDVFAAVGGGTRNEAGGTAAAIAGGAGNSADGSYSTVAGGLGNAASGSYSAALGGHQNIAGGNYSLSLGGLGNQALGDFSTAAGRASHVQPGHQGVFLYSDSRSTPFLSETADEFAVRATGGMRLISGIDERGEPLSGVILPSGSGSWEIFSSRSVKTDLQSVNGEAILAKVIDLPLYTWAYRSEPDGVFHIGPTAEDFHATFDLGQNESTIATVDADGIALAAIQELGRRLPAVDDALDGQENRIARIESEIARLRVANLKLERQRQYQWILLALLCALNVGWMLLHSHLGLSRKDQQG